MAFRKPHLKRPHQSTMALAISAIEERPNPLDDPEMAAVDPNPTSLDLPDGHLDGRFDASFHTPANLAELLNVDVLDLVVMGPVLWAGLKVLKSFWTTYIGVICVIIRSFNCLRGR